MSFPLSSKATDRWRAEWFGESASSPLARFSLIAHVFELREKGFITELPDLRALGLSSKFTTAPGIVDCLEPAFPGSVYSRAGGPHLACSVPSPLSAAVPYSWLGRPSTTYVWHDCAALLLVLLSRRCWRGKEEAGPDRYLFGRATLPPFVRKATRWWGGTACAAR